MGFLEYRVESSNKHSIYKVRFEGEGENLKAFCTCPAFKSAGLFCKHMAFLLNGDDTLLIEPSDKIEELKKISMNSPLLEKAKTHVPSKIKYVAILDDDYPGSCHQFSAHDDKEAWEKAKVIAEKSIIGLKYIMENPPEKPPEVLEVLRLDVYLKKRFNKKDDFQKKIIERTSEIMDKFAIKLEERQKLLFECGLPKNHFVKFGAIPKDHPQKALMNIFKKYEDLGISIIDEMKIQIKNEFFELVNKKYPGYPKIDKKILPNIKSINRDIDKAREKIEDFLRDNIDFFIDAFMTKL